MKTLTGVPGLSIGGVHTGDYGLYLNKKTIDLLPKSRDIEQTIYGRPGRYDYGTELGQRFVKTNFTMIGSDRPDLVDNLKQFAAVVDPRKGYQKIIFDDDPNHFIWGKYTSQASPSVDYMMTHGKFALTFKCDDPFFYAVDSRSVNWSAPYNGQTTVTNNGSVACPVTITLKAPGDTSESYAAAGIGTTNYGSGTKTSNVKITINGVSVTYTGEISGSDVVKIDTKEFTVTKNGVNDIAHWSGDFPDLAAGSNTITETDEMGVGASVTFDFTERWI